MKDRVLAALFTVIVFGAGLSAGWWLERTLPLPPPPGRFLGEFGSGSSQPGWPRGGINRAHLLAEIEKLKPQIEEFQASMTEIDAQFERDLDKVLTPEQRTLHSEQQKRHGGFHRSHMQPDGKGPLSDSQITGLIQRAPMFSVFRNVVLTMRLDMLTRELKLDDAQREQVRDLLRVHREKFLELVDSTPPPSLALSRLAPLAQRLSSPEAASAPAPKAP